MISPTSRTLEWIAETGRRCGIRDLTLLEKAIRALCLLEALARSGCPFIFKGGSAAMLQLDCANRLSVDIDIVCPPGTDVISYLNQYAQEYGFNGIKPVNRISRNNVPKTHAKCFYQVSYVTNVETEKILLDVLFEDCNYSRVERKAISSRFLCLTGDPVYVNVPSRDDLLGDKLTAYAPNTTGIPYIKRIVNRKGEIEERHCSMEIIKQLFDVASLFDRVDNLGTVRETFFRLVPIELGYRNLNPADVSSVLNDIYNTSLLICANVYSNDGSFEFRELSKGIAQIRDLVFSENYTYYSAVVNASKAAYLSVLLRLGVDEFERFSPVSDMRRFRVQPPVPDAINKIKSVRPEAFFYWCQIGNLFAKKK